MIGWIIVIVLAIIFLRWFVGKLLYVLFFEVLNLGFLPAGLNLIENIRPLGVYTIPLIGPIIEVPLHFLMTLWINIVDFVCWILCKIPFLNMELTFIKGCPDLDLTTHGTDELIGVLGLTGHRNFITHSILNPYIVIIVAIGFILYFITGIFSKKIQNFIASCVITCLCIHSAHLFADCMPRAWEGGALIKVKIFEISILKFNGFFSKLWLLGNGIFTIYIGSFFTKNMEEE